MCNGGCYDDSSGRSHEIIQCPNEDNDPEVRERGGGVRGERREGVREGEDKMGGERGKREGQERGGIIETNSDVIQGSLLGITLTKDCVA